MRQVSAKFVQRVLTVEQKKQRLSISLELRDRAASDSSFLVNVIKGDEIWVYGYDPETRVRSAEWKSPTSPHAIQHQGGGDDCFLTFMEFCEPRLYPGTLL